MTTRTYDFIEAFPKPETFRFGPVSCEPYKEPVPNNPNWMWRIKVRGRAGRVLKCGRWTAEETYEIAERLVTDGEHLRRGARPNRISTLTELFATYEGLYAPSSPLRESTKKNTKRALGHLGRHIGGKLIQVTKDTLATYVRARTAEGAAPGTIRRELRTFGAAWKHARVSRWLPRSCPERIDFPDLPTRRAYNAYTPSRAEVELVITNLRKLEKARSNGAGWPWRAVVLAVETGARVGEIESLRWKEVNLGKGVVTLDGKTGSRDVPITQRLRRELLLWRREYAHPKGFVIGVRGHIVRSRGNKKLTEACQALGQPVFTWHGVRRRFVRELARAGVPVRVAAGLMGHSPTVMLRIYDDCTEDDKVAAIASLQAARRETTTSKTSSTP